MGAQLRTPLKPLNTIVPWCTGGFKGGPQLGPHDAERRQSLGQLHVWSLLFLGVHWLMGVHWENYISISFHIINPLNMIVLWCTVGPHDAERRSSDRCCFWEYTDSWECTEKTIFAFPFILKGIRSWFDSFPNHEKKNHDKKPNTVPILDPMLDFYKKSQDTQHCQTNTVPASYPNMDTGLLTVTQHRTRTAPTLTQEKPNVGQACLPGPASTSTFPIS